MMMNDEEIKSLYNKFPSVLKNALQKGCVNFDTYEPQTTFEPQKLFRGIRGKNKDENIVLSEWDFLSHAELLDWAEQIQSPDGDTIKKKMPPELLEQVEFFISVNMMRNVKKDDLKYYSCSLSNDYDKLNALYVKDYPDRCIAEGIVNKEQGVLSDKHGNPWHIHCFLYENVGIKNSFKVCK